MIIIHETGPAGYPFAVVQGNLGEKFDLVTPDKNMGRAAVEGWVTLDAGKALLKMGGQDFDALKKLAATRDFKPVPLGVTASMTLHNKLRTIDSRNVVGRLEGSDPKLKDQYVVYTAHWDHLGIGPRRERRSDLQRREGQRRGRRRAHRDRARLHEAAGAAEAVDPLHVGDGRGAGAARVAGTTRSRRSIRWRRRSPTSTWTG